MLHERTAQQIFSKPEAHRGQSLNQEADTDAVMRIRMDAPLSLLGAIKTHTEDATMLQGGHKQLVADKSHAEQNTDLDTRQKGEVHKEIFTDWTQDNTLTV